MSDCAVGCQCAVQVNFYQVLKYVPDQSILESLGSVITMSRIVSIAVQLAIVG